MSNALFYDSPSATRLESAVLDHPQPGFAVSRFSLHQTGFLTTEVNGVPTHFNGLRDTFSVPPADNGKPGVAKLIIPFTQPRNRGTVRFSLSRCGRSKSLSSRLLHGPLCRGTWRLASGKNDHRLQFEHRAGA
jgi:hypothetical protein